MVCGAIKNKEERSINSDSLICDKLKVLKAEVELFEAAVVAFIHRTTCDLFHISTMYTIYKTYLYFYSCFAFR